MGQIITFYSYKGGVGRSMALANVATLLAQWNYRVLAVDFDLEAPGLEMFWSTFLDIPEVQSRAGLVESLSAAVEGARLDMNALTSASAKIRLPRTTGTLSVQSAGRRDGGYFKRVRQLDWREFYESSDGGAIVEELRMRWKQEYDFVLVDSRTGLTDTGGLCTVQIPDSIVLVFTATDQALRGGIDIIERARTARQKLPFPRTQVRVVPLPSRMDSSEFRLSQQWLDRFERDLDGIYSNWIPTSVRPRTLLEMTKVPYVSYFSYGETLPVLEQGTKDPAGLGYAYENLAALLALDLQEVELFAHNRDSYVRKAARVNGGEEHKKGEANVFISYAHSDKSWLDVLSKHLTVLAGSRSLISAWSDASILPGENWSDKIVDALNKADVAVLLVSPDYLVSEFAQREMSALLKAAEERGLRLFWIPVRHSLVAETPLSKFQAAWDPSKPLSALTGPALDEALVQIARRIAEAAGRPF